MQSFVFEKILPGKMREVLKAIEAYPELHNIEYDNGTAKPFYWTLTVNINPSPEAILQLQKFVGEHFPEFLSMLSNYN